MLKRALFAGAALVIGAMYMQGAVTPASAGQIKVKPKISVKPKPRIRVVRPKVRIKIDPNRLARDRQEKKKKDTTPRLTQPSGTPAGYDTANRPGGDIPGTDNIDTPNSPTLDLRDGLIDLFLATGGNLNHARNIKDLDALRGLSAMRDALEAAAGGIPDPILDSSIGGRSASTEFDGPARKGGQFSDPGHAAGGWRLSDAGGSRQPQRRGTHTFLNFTRTTESGSQQTFRVTRWSDGTVETEYNLENGDVIITTTEADLDGDGEHEAMVRIISADDDKTDTVSSTTTTTQSVRTEVDQDGDGEPDEIDSGSKKAGGGDQGGDWVDPNYRDRGGSIWTPLRGTVIRTVSPLDKTSQPPPSDVQGTVMVSGGNSGPALGPEAVTNTGDGGFIAGEGRGGGGSMIDPCARVRDCGGGPDGGGSVPEPGTGPAPASN